MEEGKVKGLAANIRVDLDQLFRARPVCGETCMILVGFIIKKLE
jgi:hypothetical protein